MRPADLELIDGADRGAGDAMRWHPRPTEPDPIAVGTYDDYPTDPTRQDALPSLWHRLTNTARNWKDHL